MVQMNFIFNLINLAAEQKTKRKKIVLPQFGNESEGNIRIKLEKNLFYYIFFFNFKNWVGRVGKTKNKKLWPNLSLC